jgi:hypothetical protein
MTRNKRHLLVGLFAMIIVAFITGAAISEKTVTIVGTVNGAYQIVADTGEIYEVGETEKGDEVVYLVGKNVKVTGTVEEIEDMKMITIDSYEVIEE